MVKIEITTEENDLLKKHFKTSPLVTVRLKSSAILMRGKGVGIRDIADVVSRDERTLYRWMDDWNETRMKSIFTGHKNNENASKLTKKQKEEIRGALKKAPSDYAIPKTFWDVPTLKTYIKTTFDIVYESSRSYHILLAFCNLSFKYPDTFDRRRNETHITERMAGIREEIKPFLKDEHWEVFASDEVRMDQEAEIRRAWLRKGERTIVQVNRQKESQSYIGFLNQKTFHCHVYRMDWQNQEEVIKAYKKFLKRYPNKKICVVWDNAPFHKGKDIREKLKEGEILERVHLIPMPPYAPDKNPIEKVWNAGKKSAANIQHTTFTETKEAFERYVRGKRFVYRI